MLRLGKPESGPVAKGGGMESFWGSVKLMLFVYALAAAVSLTVAWSIKMIFAGVKMQKARAAARAAALAEPSREPDNGAADRTD